MLIKRAPSIKPSEITDRSVYLNRRRFLELAGVAAAGSIVGTGCAAETPGDANKKLTGVKKSGYSADEAPNSYEDITTYNNFYEFGTGKGDPHRKAGDFVTQPWSVTVSGECDKPGVYQYEDLVKEQTLEERIYRLRCVEAWSMVVPWVGIPLAGLLSRFAPNSSAKYVRFTTVVNPEQMPGQRRRVLDWPYVEGLTIAEAMNPLALMVVGLYGEVLPNQNGAPLRLMAPWKYGFKNIKSINQIHFQKRQPRNTWAISTPNEYGFYANVNPNVDHPRWSQARERRIGAGLFAAKQPTLMFNGYADEVAHLYAGLDLAKNF